jgi:hypothetical protein
MGARLVDGNCGGGHCQRGHLEWLPVSVKGQLSKKSARPINIPHPVRRFQISLSLPARESRPCRMAGLENFARPWEHFKSGGWIERQIAACFQDAGTLEVRVPNFFAAPLEMPKTRN